MPVESSTSAARASSNPIAGGPCVYPQNPNPQMDIYWALLADLKVWVAKGKEPPPSSYPRLAEHELVPANADAMEYPRTAVLPNPDGMVNPLLTYELGSGFDFNDVSGTIASEPPAVVGVIAQLVPRVNADGNEIGGIHTVQQEAALGTYLGWNVTAAGFAKGQLCSLAGSFIPFAATKAEREKLGDPRLSLEERYGDREGFECIVKHAAKALVERRLLLEPDAAKIVEQASKSNVLPAAKDASAESRAIAERLCATAN
jgi:hypothetical protein